MHEVAVEKKKNRAKAHVYVPTMLNLAVNYSVHGLVPSVLVLRARCCSPYLSHHVHGCGRHHPSTIGAAQGNMGSLQSIVASPTLQRIATLAPARRCEHAMSRPVEAARPQRWGRGRPNDGETSPILQRIDTPVPVHMREHAALRPADVAASSYVTLLSEFSYLSTTRS
jgi:hypothetical protein